MNNNTNENGNLSLKLPQGGALLEENFLYIALRHRWIILSTVIVFLVIAYIYLLKAIPIYTSSSSLYVEQKGPKIIGEYEGVMTQSKNYLYTQSELIKSTPIVADAADNPQIRQLKTFHNIDNIAGYIKGNLDVSVGKKDDIISVSLSSPYPEEAAQIVNEVVNSYVEYNSTRKRSTVSEVLRIIQKEKNKRDKELSEKFAQMLDFTRKNGVVSSDDKGGHIVFQKLSKMSEALTDVQLAAINARADFEATKSMINEPAKIKQFAEASPTGGVHISVNDTETQLRNELKNAEMQLDNARYYCTENHPSIKAIQAKIDRIKQKLNEEAKEFADGYLKVTQLKWIAAKQREDELQTSFNALCQAAQDLGIKAAEYSVLQSELNRTERLCEILDNRIKELNVTEDTGALNISILEVARAAGGPSYPKKSKTMAMALFFGLIFGYGFAILRDWLDYRLHSTEEISAILGVPVLGVVPTMADPQTIATRGQKVWFELKPVAAKIYQIIHTALSPAVAAETKAAGTASSVAADSKTALNKQSMVNRGQKVHLKPRSTVAEAYRTIRTAVFFGIPKGEAKTILITSPAPGDGKSTLASNLAIAMAQAGQKTLVLDADFRKPVQHNIFEVDNERGTSSILAEKHTIEQAIQAGPVEKLDVLPCGPEVPNPSEILNSNLFAGLLQTLAERYDRIIIDSPPVTPVADSQILAAICDITLLVLRAEKSTRKQSQQARDSLLSVGGHLLGAIVNDVPRKRSHYGYGYGYGHYGYGGYGYYGHSYGYYGKEERKKEKEYV